MYVGGGTTMWCDACHAFVERSWRWCPDCGGSLSPLEPGFDTELDIYAVDSAATGAETGRPDRL
jgi:hypothetical protein